METPDQFIIKLFFQILQALHHISALKLQASGGKPTQGFQRHINNMEQFLRPAQPNSGIFNSLHQLHLTWAKKTAELMTRHYNTQLSEILGRLTAHSLSKFQIQKFSHSGLQWGRARFGRKLSDNVITEYHNFVSSLSKIDAETPLKIKTTAPRQITPPQNLRKSDNVPTSNFFSPLATLADAVSLTTSKRPLSSPPNSPAKRLQSSPNCRKSLSISPITPPRTFADAIKTSPTFPNHKHRPINKSNWKLPNIIKPTLILGDSNLTRITQRDPNVQIEPYPGAKINHLIQLIQSYSHQGIPKNILFNIGINHRSHWDRNEIVQSLQTLLRVTRKQFPKSRIMFSSLIYCNALFKTHSREACNIRLFNQHINKLKGIHVRNLSTFNGDPSGFKFAKDGIHWMSETANDVFGQWLELVDFLNLNLG